MKTKNNTLLQVIDNEQGFVLVLAMVMLVILSLMGGFAVSNTGIELQISGNERSAQEIFYVAESGWMRGFQWIENWGTSSAPLLINGVDADATLPLVAELYDQELGGGTLSYTIGRSSTQFKAPGNSKEYIKFLYTITSTASGNGNAARNVAVGVEKVSR